MPRRRRLVKGRRDRLTDGQRTELLHGHAYFACPGVPENDGFGDDETARAAAWETHRDQLMAEWATEPRPGRRPWAWWEYDAPKNRDAAVHETIQLVEMGELGAEERALLEATTWPLYERQASCAREPYGEAAYWERRRYYGIPDTWQPPAERAG